MAATSGVQDAEDVVKALLVGADVACTTSAVLHYGPWRVRQLLDGLEEDAAAHHLADQASEDERDREPEV